MKKLISLMVALLVLVAVQFARAEEESGSVSFWEKTKVTGSLDVNYHYNLNRPTTTAAATATNVYRVFDANPNTINIGLFELAVENSPADWVTLRSDLDFGHDATIYHAAGLGGLNAAEIAAGAQADFFDLQQAYVALKADGIGNGMTFKIGKFVTLHGMEVIEAASNYNISRGLLFNYAIPFTHTGIIATYPFSDQVTLDFGVVNGWNNVIDNNNGKSVHGMLTVKPTDQLTWILGGTAGPETAGSDRPIRTLIDTSLIYNVNNDLTVALNYDWARDGGFTVAGTQGIQDWLGVAAYIDWKATDVYGLTLRGEYFDDDVLALGAVPAGATASGRVFEGTLTSHARLIEGLDLRFEYRHDHGNAASFLRGTGAARRFQDTIGSQLVYSF